MQNKINQLNFKVKISNEKSFIIVDPYQHINNCFNQFLKQFNLELGTAIKNY